MTAFDYNEYQLRLAQARGGSDIAPTSVDTVLYLAALQTARRESRRQLLLSWEGIVFDPGKHPRLHGRFVQDFHEQSKSIAGALRDKADGHLDDARDWDDKDAQKMGDHLYDLANKVETAGSRRQLLHPDEAKEVQAHLNSAGDQASEEAADFGDTDHLSGPLYAMSNTVMKAHVSPSDFAKYHPESDVSGLTTDQADQAKESLTEADATAQDTLAGDEDVDEGHSLVRGYLRDAAATVGPDHPAHQHIMNALNASDLDDVRDHIEKAHDAIG